MVFTNFVIAVTRLKTNPFLEEVMNYENKKRIHYLLQQIMNSYSEMFPRNYKCIITLPSKLCQSVFI